MVSSWLGHFVQSASLRLFPAAARETSSFMAQWTRPQSRIQDNDPFADLDDDAHWRAYALYAGAGLLGLVAFAALTHFTSFPVALISTGLCAIGGLVVYDWIARRRWERDVTRQINKVSERHDRLVREVARGRSDLHILKDGLAETADLIERKTRDIPSFASFEGKVIEALGRHFSALGGRPATPLSQLPKNNNIMALEVTPSPAANDAQTLRARSPQDETLALLRQALREERIEAFLQPVAALPQRQTRMYEILTRLRQPGGLYVPANDFLAMAADHELMPAIDNAVLLHCLQMLHDRRSTLEDETYILNVTQASFHDGGFMNELITFLARNKTLAGRLIFEFAQEELNRFDRQTGALVDGLNQLGCRFSVDRIDHSYLNIEQLKAAHVSFLKIRADWLLQEAGREDGARRIAVLKDKLDQAGIAMVVEKVEDEAALRELLDFDIDYGQGWLFGKPDHRYAYSRKKKNRAA